MAFAASRTMGASSVGAKFHVGLRFDNGFTVANMRIPLILISQSRPIAITDSGDPDHTVHYA
jgi:hypothetical protein